MEKLRRMVLAVGTFLVVVCVLGIGAKPVDALRVDADQISFWASLESAVRYFFAAGIGAIVAGRSFVVPAVSLAALVWATTTYTVYSIAQPTGAILAEVAVEQLAGLVLLTLAVISGALLGRWFYKREIKAAAVDD